MGAILLILAAVNSINCCYMFCKARDLARYLCPSKHIKGMEHIAEVVGGKTFR